MEATAGKFRPRSLELKDGRAVRMSMVAPEDTEELIVFLRTISEETTHTLQYPGRTYSSYAIQQRIARTMQSHADLLLSIRDEGRIVAHLDFQAQNERHPWVKHVARFGMAVLQSHQRNGIGAILLQNMMEWAEKVGIHRIETLIRTDNDPALTLCRDAGFQLEGLRHNSLLIDGQWKDEYYLSKIQEATHSD
jgi:RimJ/RimL family protein N-acetyltransferase